MAGSCHVVKSQGVKLLRTYYEDLLLYKVYYGTSEAELGKRPFQTVARCW